MTPKPKKKTKRESEMLAGLREARKRRETDKTIAKIEAEVAELRTAVQTIRATLEKKWMRGE